jgi:glycerol-3-phosphate acyltransferase PlsY
MSGPLAVILSYLVGGIPFALVAGRLKGVDVLRHGSGNPGATNAIRVLGPALGVPVLLLDIAKGWAAVTLFAPRSDGIGGLWPLGCGAAAVLGHVFPLGGRFRGGKGVATAAGAFLGLAPVAIGIVAAMFCLALAATRYISVASMVGALTLPISVAALGADAWTTSIATGIALLVFWRHRGNLARLRDGTERRLGARKATS